MSILGVDPGLSGALAFLEAGTLSVFDMPVLRLTRNGKARGEIDYYELARIVDSWPHTIEAAYVERVGSMPGQGVSSSFAFGRATGIVIGIIAASFVPIIECPPITWRRAVGIAKGAGKDAARAIVCGLHPMQAELFRRVKDDGRADAALLAVHGRRTWPGKEAAT